MGCSQWQDFICHQFMAQIGSGVHCKKCYPRIPKSEPCPVSRPGSSQGNTLRRRGWGVVSGKTLYAISLWHKSVRAYTAKSVTLAPRNLNHALFPGLVQVRVTLCGAEDGV